MQMKPTTITETVELGAPSAEQIVATLTFRLSHVQEAPSSGDDWPEERDWRWVIMRVDLPYLPVVVDGLRFAGAWEREDAFLRIEQRRREETVQLSIDSLRELALDWLAPLRDMLRKRDERMQRRTETIGRQLRESPLAPESGV